MEPHNYRILVIDALRRFEGPNLIPIVYARDCETALAMLRKGPWNQLWLDNDLSDIPVLWMLEHKPVVKQVYVQGQDRSWAAEQLMPHYRVLRTISPLLVVPDETPQP